MESGVQERPKLALAKEALLSPENYTFLQDQIYKSSGIVLDETKLYLIESRLLPIVRQERIGNLNDLCALLRAVGRSALKKQVVEAMTTNETLFFRDATAFEALQNTVLPAIAEQRKSVKKISIWSAAASSGQESYSLAMLLLEMGLTGWQIKILGTDLNDAILQRARTGRYSQIEVNRGLPAKYLVKYFQAAGTEWQIKDQVRSLVEFVPLDLRQSLRTFGPFDLVLCRNVLIYFDIATKSKILGEIRDTLFPKGLLLMGSAETTLNLNDDFVRKVIDRTTFYEAP